MPTEESVQKVVDTVIRQHRTSSIDYFPYAPGVTDLYNQNAKAFGPPISLVGRAILKPTPEQISVIGNDEQYDIAFLFSKVELKKKFPLADDGEWIDVDGEIEWFNRRFRIEEHQPSGQIGQTFSLLVVMANTIPGRRDS